MERNNVNSRDTEDDAGCSKEDKEKTWINTLFPACTNAFLWTKF